jgi:hypothetical protein
MDDLLLLFKKYVLIEDKPLNGFKNYNDWCNSMAELIDKKLQQQQQQQHDS